MVLLREGKVKSTPSHRPGVWQYCEKVECISIVVEVMGREVVVVDNSLVAS